MKSDELMEVLKIGTGSKCNWPWPATGAHSLPHCDEGQACECPGAHPNPGPSASSSHARGCLAGFESNVSVSMLAASSTLYGGYGMSGSSGAGALALR